MFAHFCGASKGFIKALKAIKAFIKLFEASQRSVEIKIQVNFLSSSGIGKGKVKFYTKFK